MKILSYNEDGTPNIIMYSPEDPEHFTNNNHLFNQFNAEKTNATEINSDNIKTKNQEYKNVVNGSIVANITEDQHILSIINTCQYRSCSCSGALCSIDPKENKIVDYNICTQCVRDRGLDKPKEAEPRPGLGSNLFKQAKTFVKSMVRHAVSGTTLTDEQAESRLKICQTNQCGFYEESNLGPRCGSCGCFLAIKSKMSLESCPLDPPRWGPMENSEKVS